MHVEGKKTKGIRRWKKVLLENTGQRLQTSETANISTVCSPLIWQLIYMIIKRLPWIQLVLWRFWKKNSTMPKDCSIWLCAITDTVGLRIYGTFCKQFSIV